MVKNPNVKLLPWYLWVPTNDVYLFYPQQLEENSLSKLVHEKVTADKFNLVNRK